MGEHATSGEKSNIKNTVKGMKRLVGLAFDDPRAIQEMQWQPALTFCPVPHAAGGPPSVGVKIHAHGDREQVVPVEAIAGMMIHHMGEIAGKKASADTAVFPQDWVVAIPNYFTDAQRRALQAGCEIVGIAGVQRFMHENTATALSYGIFKDLKKEFTKDKPTHVMFIDMGASAYTVSIATFEPGQLTVKAAYCDSELGGRDFDWVIAQWIAQQFEDKYKGKLSGKPLDKPKVRLKLMAAAEKAKKTLSPAGVKETRLHLEMLQDELDFSTSLQAADYEAMCQPLLARLSGPIQQALAEAKLQPTDLAAVEIVGGSTRIGAVKRTLLECLPGIANLSTTMNADEAVARGAALQSAILSPRFKVLPYDIQEAQPYPIQISWPAVGGEDASSVVMFDRGLSFPIVRRVTLKRAGPFSVQATYDASQQDQYGLPAGQHEIATFNIQNTAKTETKVRVNVKQDIHGILQLSSAQMVEEIEAEPAAAAEGADDNKKEGEEEEKKKKIKKTNLECTVQRPLDWTVAEINKYNEVDVAMANTDRIVRETADMRNELESYIYDMRDKISSDSQLGPYGTDKEKADFTAKNEAMENWLYEDGFDATKSVYGNKLAELKKLGGPLEQRYEEAQNRPAAITSLQSTLEMYTNWLNSSQAEERYAHITEEEREKVRAKTDETSSWMYDMLDKQGNLGLSENPILTVKELNQKQRALTDVCGPVMHKPKPKPKPKPAVPKKDEGKPDPPTAEEGNPDPPTAEKGAEKTDGDGEPMEGVEVVNNQDGDKMDEDA